MADTWTPDLSIVNGLLDTGHSWSSPAIFDDSGIWKLISGDSSDAFYGWYWNGSTWVSDSSIVSGLSAGTFNTPTIFNYSGTLKLISGCYLGTYHGFYWNGTTWISDSSIISGLGDIGDYSSSTVFNDSDTWKLICKCLECLKIWV